MKTLTETARKNLEQNLGAGHPYTCGHCRDRFGIYFRSEFNLPLSVVCGDIIPISVVDLDKYRNQGYHIMIEDWKLVATDKHWLCPSCGYTQEFK
jgi:hypothetical protein